MLRSTNNGFATLSLLDDSLQQVRNQLHTLDTNAEAASQGLASLNREESKLYTQLARLKLDEIDEGEVTLDALGTAEQRAYELLQDREKAIANLADETQISLKDQSEIEAQRAQEAILVEQAAAELHAQVTATQTRLESDTAYVEARGHAQSAVDKVIAATEKTDRAKEEHARKASPYQEDPIFMYLWERGYGTQEYRAGKLARVFDRWVADHIEFEAARRNYWMLLEIPKRLTAHVAKLQIDAEELLAATEIIERREETADGVVALEERVETLRASLATFDEKITDLETHYNDCLMRRDQYAAATDPYFTEAVALLTKSFRAYPIYDLQRAAQATEGYEDDSIVSNLGELRQQSTALEQEHRAAQRASQSLTTRVHELERIRRSFKQRGFDAPHSQFRNGTALTSSVDDFMRGLISSTELWRTLERSQRFIRRRSYTNYGVRPGSLRIPRGVRIPSNWGGGGVRVPRGGSGGGGFGTGGGF